MANNGKLANATQIMTSGSSALELALHKISTVDVPQGKSIALVYHGEWFHPLKEAIDAFIASTQKAVNGEYVFELYKGNIDIRARSSSSGLFFPDVRSINSASFNQKECAPAAHIRGLPYELIARRNKLAGISWEGSQQ